MASIEEFWNVAGKEVKVTRGNGRAPAGGRLVQLKVRWRDVDGKARARRIDVIEGRRSEAEQACTDLLAQVEKARAVGVRWRPRDEERVPLLSAAIAAYIEHIARAVRDGNRAAGTLEKRAALLKRFLGFVGGEHADVGVLTASKFTAFYDSLTCAPSSKFVYASHLHSFYDWCSTSDKFRAHVNRPPALADMSIYPALAAAPVSPTWQECDAMIPHLLNECDRRAVVIMRYTGVRISQACRLNVDDFDFDTCTLKIRRGNGKSRREKQGRTMPVSRYLIEEMRRWTLPAVGPVVATGERVSLVPNDMSKRIKDAWARSGVRREVWDEVGRGNAKPCHAYRYALISELRARRAEHDAREFLVGHTEGTVARYYLDPALALGDDVREAVGMIAPIGGPYTVKRERQRERGKVLKYAAHA